ncbi:hypothetical protein H6P81_005909 [Aristolochia fimbriata]|uniref:Pectinesterase inhibitor domain-containing protein n=1 Tax=Aristolochia fimbriata TaxID=158543 RepID=A0AAV7EVU4_ARIFI|nr:hypothetical protein H6P81_005909 [Aristolochia fimbriata]
MKVSAALIMSSLVVHQAIFFVLFFCINQAIPSEAARSNGGLVAKTCKKIAADDPAVDYAFCLTSLQSGKHSNTADLRGLGIIASNLARINATRSRRKAQNLKKKATDLYDKTRLADCEELFQLAVSSLRDSTRAFRGERYDDANINLSAAMTDAETCDDGFAEMEGHVSPLTKETRNLKGLCAVGLGITWLLTRR